MKLAVSVPPHVRLDGSIASINWSKIAVLIPVSLLAVYVFGLNALGILVISILSAVLTEAVIQRQTQQKITVKDGDAVLTGLLIALLLPTGVPLWIPVVGAAFAIALVKHGFGGLGSTLFNPAIAALVFLNMSWNALMVPLSVPHISQYSDIVLELGAGRLGEVSPLALIGVLYLLYKRYIDWRISGAFLITALMLVVLIGDDLSYVFTGLFFIGVFLMATNSETSPVTKTGRVYYGIMCGVLTVIYGYFSYNYGLGVLYAIFFANAVSPFIEKNTHPTPIDEVTA